MPFADVRPLVLLGALGLAAGGCSEEGGDTAASQPAGKVVEVQGAVKAARQGAERPLAGGDPVYRDDTVTTGSDGSVTILLAHNQARWSLAAGRSRRVDRSAAWRAEAGGASAFDDEQTLPTSAAGRHSEPQAGDTRATAPAPAAESAADETHVAEAPAAAPPPRPARRGSRRPSERAKGPAPAAPDQQVKTRGLALGAVPDTGAGGAADDAAEPQPAPMAVPSGRRATLRGLKVSGSRGKKELAAEISARFGEAVQLCAQLAPQAGDVAVTFHIGRGGDVASVKLSGPRSLVARVGDCLRVKAAELSFPRRREGTTLVRQTVRFEVP